MIYKHIRSLSRGIEVLKYLNTVSGAHAADIGRHLDLPRPTVHRILETLEELNLIYQGPFSREYRVTPSVRGLAGQRTDFGELRGAAWGALQELTEQVIWPSDLAVFHEGRMLIVESTHRLSPLSVDIGMIGLARSMFDSPLGRAYLSDCSAAQRAKVLERLHADQGPGADWAQTLATVDRIVADGRRDGFSTCAEKPHPRCASMAAAVCVAGDVVGVINVVWNRADLSYEEARDKLGGPLLAARDRIAVELGGAPELPAFRPDMARVMELAA
ncbi:Transcriptional regulator [Novosphingobium sp. Rr 2-17]|uniref:helix-turn-helix domain-containing protein n=1 Tax=Novosphingobium sp. Rr 2-17 TaxID=555793 RepID=UPI0002697B99|nr:helix-turn-helix domain-containing protein [Novosphingobium sp. Rr 2-17]EIZ78325.1 Transcriptional regulator [Novosphingobium sp. Rr 2-17]